MNAPAMALSDLLARLRAGEPESLDAALEALFRAHHRQVLALCRSLTRNSAAADDALQETFIAARAALPAFRGEARASTWLCRIAIRIALRMNARQPQLAEPDPNTAHDPREAHVDRDALSQAMAALPAEQRTVISLFAIEGLTHAEIAEILGVPEGTIWSRLHVARRKLAAALSD